MPAIINIAANLLFGAALALLTRHSRALKQEAISWQLLFLMSFEALIFTPVATYLFRFYPQWSMLYAFDPQLFPELDRWIGMLSAAAVGLNFAAAVGGFFLARQGVRTGKVAWALGPIVAAALTLVLTAAIFPERIALIGDYDAFWQGNAVLFLKRAPGWVGLALYLGAIGFLRWVHVRYRHHDPTLF